MGTTIHPPPVHEKTVELQEFEYQTFEDEEREEEFDITPREAKFAIRTTDLVCWKSFFRSGQQPTDSDPSTIQHWAVVVHFPRGKKTYLFEAWKDENNGKLQPGRAENVDYEVFEKAKYFDTFRTSPYHLLEIAKDVPRGNYHVFHNNCQTWVQTFLEKISPNLLNEALHSLGPSVKRR
jgi:hypothetical protein